MDRRKCVSTPRIYKRKARKKGYLWKGYGVRRKDTKKVESISFNANEIVEAAEVVV